MDWPLMLYQKKSSPYLRSYRFSFMLSSRSFIVSYFTFRPVIHLGLIFVTVVRSVSRFTPLHVIDCSGTICWEDWCLCITLRAILFKLHEGNILWICGCLFFFGERKGHCELWGYSTGVCCVISPIIHFDREYFYWNFRIVSTLRPWGFIARDSQTHITVSVFLRILKV